MPKILFSVQYWLRKTAEQVNKIERSSWKQKGTSVALSPLYLDSLYITS